MSERSLTSYSWDEPVDAAAISPAGKYLAFCMGGKLLIQGIRTGQKSSLALPEGFYLEEVAWFPDETKLLLQRKESRWVQVKGETIRESSSSLWSLSILPGGIPQKLVDRGGGASVSPDGSLIAFGRGDTQRQTSDIWLAGSNGESPRRIHAATEPHQMYLGPTWSSDGQRIFYLHLALQRQVWKYHGIESCDLRGANVSTVVPSREDFSPISSCMAQGGRMFFTAFEFRPASLAMDIWEIRVDTASGRPLDVARRVTQWSTFASGQVVGPSVTADGKILVVRKGHAQADVYVAELDPAGKTMKTSRRLTIDENDDAAWGWTADSRAILFQSNRNGSMDIFKQEIDRREAEVLAATAEQEHHPQLSPDGSWILYLVSKRPQDKANRLLQIPAGGGGPPEVVLTGDNLKNFSCAREAKLCVVVEENAGKQVLTTFDPSKGRGQQLPESDYPTFAGGVLSPQGRLIEKMKSGPEGLYIRVRSLTGGHVEEITFKNLTREYSFHGWSPSGKAMYLCDLSPFEPDFTALYVGLDGGSQVLWKRGTSEGRSLGSPIPSPDGRHLAYTAIRSEMNAWMLENF